MTHRPFGPRAASRAFLAAHEIPQISAPPMRPGTGAVPMELQEAHLKGLTPGACLKAEADPGFTFL